MPGAYTSPYPARRYGGCGDSGVAWMRAVKHTDADDASGRVDGDGSSADDDSFLYRCLRLPQLLWGLESEVSRCGE